MSEDCKRCTLHCLSLYPYWIIWIAADKILLVTNLANLAMLIGWVSRLFGAFSRGSRVLP